MNAPPRVSVIIPSFNRANVIADTLRSVLDQQYPNLEILVCDDGSTDETVNIARSFGDPVRVLPIAKNSGLPAVGRNRGLRAATGDYIAFLDSDDLWKPGKLAKQIAFATQYSDAALIHGYAELIDDDSNSLGIRHEGQLPPGPGVFLPLLSHCFITISTVLVPRRVLKDVGLMNEDPFYRAREDYEWFLRIAGRYPVRLMDDVLACYRKSPTSISSDERTWKMRPEDALMHRQIWFRKDLWADHATSLQLRRIVFGAFVENARYWRGQRRPTRALWNARLALQTAPWHPLAWLEMAKTMVRFLKNNAA